MPCLDVHFSLNNHFLKDTKYTNSGTWLANLNHAHSHLPRDFLISNEDLIHYQSKDPCAHSMVIHVPSTIWLLNLVWFAYYEHVLQSLLNLCLLSFLRSTPKHIPLNSTCPLNVVLKSGTSTLRFYAITPSCPISWDGGTPSFIYFMNKGEFPWRPLAH
jgi:hypothetical protein